MRPVAIRSPLPVVALLALAACGDGGNGEPLPRSNPLGENPNGWQLFAMQPEGSDLRQLSNARGAVRGADGTVEVETVDAFWSAPYQ